MIPPTGADVAYIKILEADIDTLKNRVSIYRGFANTFAVISLIELAALAFMVLK